jgi:regulator of protease activity HflC (stomatin/prohibitin superfamily)
VLADAEAYAVTSVSKAITDGGSSAVEFEIRKIQAKAIEEIGKGNNSKILLIPSDTLAGLNNAAKNILGKLV